MNVNLRKFKNLKFLIIIFSLIIFTFSIVISIVITDYKNMNELNGLINSKTKSFKFNDSGKIHFKSLLANLDDYKESKIYLEFNPVPKYLSNTTLFGKAIFYNYNIDNKFPIVEGHPFTIEEINSNEKIILVGKNLKKNIIRENDIDYFTIDDIKYRVIGILGNRDKQTGYDDTFLVNMKSMDYYSDKRATWSLNVSDNSDLDSILNRYEEIGRQNNSLFQFVNNASENNKVNIIDILKNYGDFIRIFEMILGFGILNLVIIIYYWIEKSIREIGIRKAYGATNFDIAKYILIRYELTVIISIAIGIILHYIFKNVLKVMFPTFSFQVYIENVVIATIVFMFIGLITAVVPLIKAIKVQPVIIMKGKLR